MSLLSKVVDTYLTQLRFCTFAEQGLVKRDVKLVLDDYLDDIPTDGFTSVKTRSGTTNKADVIVSRFIAFPLGAGMTLCFLSLVQHSRGTTKYGVHQVSWTRPLDAGGTPDSSPNFTIGGLQRHLRRW